MKHIVLLGDSIFDNQSYVGEGPDVVAQLRHQLSGEGKATLRAIDGSVIENVRQQTLGLPDDVTHLFVSVGGNNAILNADVLQMKASSGAEVFGRLADLADTFEFHYREMLQAVLSLNKPTALCTIYYPRIPEEFAQKIALAALAVFNDVIIRQAFLAGLPLIDLRLICNEESDYANEIEPSEAGGEKIARTILRLVSEHDFENRRTEVYF
jgi:hypothetical protein